MWGKAAIIPSVGIMLPTVFSCIPDGQDSWPVLCLELLSNSKGFGVGGGGGFVCSGSMGYSDRGAFYAAKFGQRCCKWNARQTVILRAMYSLLSGVDSLYLLFFLGSDRWQRSPVRPALSSLPCLFILQVFPFFLWTIYLIRVPAEGWLDIITNLWRDS